MEVLHEKIDQGEIQSLDLREIVEHKARQAYEKLHKPVLVEDTSLMFTALGKLPWPFIKFFLKELWHEGICRLLDGKDRTATAQSMFGYFDGERLEFFVGELHGTISDKPGFDNGFGWDRIFIPDGYDIVRSELSEEDYKTNYLKVKPINQLRGFLVSRK
jgi:non-canonical purine NTP pyrophosphatase (RdgB/HAM1 family)